MGPEVGRADLPARAKTELVLLKYPLEDLDAGDVAPAVRRLISGLGTASANLSRNELVLLDTAGDLQRVLPVLDRIAQATRDRHLLLHRCDYCHVETVVLALKETFGHYARGRPPASERLIIERCEPQIVMIWGPVEKLEQARLLINKLDAPRNGIAQRPEPIIQSYMVRGELAESLVAALQEISKDSPATRVAALHKAAIMVYAEPEIQRRIASALAGKVKSAGHANSD
jgi:hypothetical protein